MTVVMITQYMEEALAADRVIVMAEGRLIAQVRRECIQQEGILK